MNALIWRSVHALNASLSVKYSLRPRKSQPKQRHTSKAMSTAFSEEHGAFDRLGQKSADRHFKGGYLFRKRFDIFDKRVRVPH